MIFQKLKQKLSDWLLSEEKSQISQLASELKKESDRLANYESELLHEARIASIPSVNGESEEQLYNPNRMAIDEFGVERMSGEAFLLAPDDTEKYILDEGTHKVLPLSKVIEAVKNTPMGKKHRITESSVTDLQNDIIKDFIGFYGGSVTNLNFFEWSYYKQRLMIERSHEEGQKGVGKAIKDIITNFAIGSGITQEYTDIDLKDNDLRHKVNDYLNYIWEENDLDRIQYTVADFIADRGEVFLKLSKSPRGFRVEVIDPIEIVDYLYDYTMHKPVVWFRSYYKNNTHRMREPLLSDGGIDPDTGEEYSIRHFKFNVPDTICRGRSDMYSVLFWVKLYNDFLKCRSRLNRFRSSVAWHKKITGGERAVGSAGTRIQKPFPPGTVIVTDDKTTYEALDANINAGDVKDDADAFKSMIASTIQIPHHWLFGSGENTNLATAKNMSAVPKRKFLRRQKDIANIFTSIFWEGLTHFLKKDQMDAARRMLVVSKIYPRALTNELMDKEYSTESDPRRLTTDSTEQQIREAVMYNNGLPLSNKNEIVVGLNTIKRKHLRVILPPVDEENAEDMLRKARTVETLRSAGVGSNHAVYKIMGIDYRPDQELLEREITNGDYAAIGTAKRMIAAGKKVDNPATADMIELDPRDDNADGIVNKAEEPGVTYDDIGDTVDISRTPKGGA